MSGYQLSRKETFSVSMVLFIGFFYFVSLASGLSQTQSIPLNRLFGLTEIKFLFLGILYWTGAVSFFRLKNAGWIICAATLLNFVVVMLQFVVSITQSPKFSILAAIVIVSFLLMLMAFVFLFNKQTRIKFIVTNKSYLFMICVYAILLVLTFLL